MPELPEVETIKNHLERHIKGCIFQGIRIFDTRPIREPSIEEFCRRLTGKQVLGLERRGKYLVIRLSEGENLIIHLRMTGSLLWKPKTDERYKRVEFLFKGGGRVVFTDIRRFGTICLVRKPSEIVGNLGVEPLCKQFSARYLEKVLSKRKTPVKTVLLNQELIAGIGNMYADEALCRAGIHPLRPACSIKPSETKILHKSIRLVLNKGISKQGASIRDYRQPDGSRGSAHTEFIAAHRLGQPCPSCGTAIARIIVGQRGTYYCPLCQPAGKPEKKLKE